VRESSGVTVFADDQRIVSAAVPGREPNLHLVGTFGTKGSAVYFDNLVIRVPPAPAKTRAKRSNR
jgi:hypothetical protein